ncbi:hypothetical protein [Paenibacillus sp. UNC499MF]|uniref:hypothetical protein n=1 Tax=Paenibacillus sp. UNC499MF TaxID=1502751 RepID=UPI00089FC9C8|nr:hypothetical protein [Paenibacillus sp. UNC499MF]SEG64475.1 hypothetical protein SAMN02799616_03995 [Paenibacillus sp. UNC499MF]
MSEKQNPEACENVVDLLENMEVDPLTKERIFKRVANKLETGTIQPENTKKDAITMLNKKWKTAAATAAAVIIIGGALSTTSYAQGMFDSILARFQVGNMKIVQTDKERPAPETNVPAQQDKAAEPGEIKLPEQPKLTVQEARAATGMNFPVPAWIADFEYSNTVIQAKTMVEVQYRQGEKTVNFLISKGGENGIETTDEVKTEVIAGKKVYFANGIVLWEDNGFTVELYAQEDFDTASLEKIIKSFAVGKPLTQEEIDKAKSTLDTSLNSEKSGPAPAPASN